VQITDRKMKAVWLNKQMAHYTTTDIAVLAYKTGIAKDFRY
jgi:predicted small secreted protein